MTQPNVRIGIIDDSDLVRGLLGQMLRKIDGLEIVGEAADAESGVQLVRKCAPDIVTLDMRMKGTSGLDALEQIKELPNPPVVLVLTDYPFASFRRRCAELGAEEFFDKASDLPKLVDTIQSYVTRAQS